MASPRVVLQTRKVTNSPNIVNKGSTPSGKFGSAKQNITSFRQGMRVYIPDREQAWLPAIVTTVQQEELVVRVDHPGGSHEHLQEKDEVQDALQMYIQGMPLKPG